MATARASVADISSVSRANSFTAPAESSNCRFPRPGLVADINFFPAQNGCQKSPIIVTLPPLKAKQTRFVGKNKQTNIGNDFVDGPLRVLKPSIWDLPICIASPVDAQKTAAV